MKIIQWVKSGPRNRGIALILVTGVLALITILLVAMFSATETEYRSTQGFVASQSAKQLADMAVAIVEAQIQNGQNSATSIQTAGNRDTYATQPGAVTVFKPDGTFRRALKLYSSSSMVANIQSNLVNGRDDGGSQMVPAAWDADKARFVDLNEPVIRTPESGSAKTKSLFFPVIDPRAAYNFNPAGNNSGSSQLPDGAEPIYGNSTTKVEGFSYVAAPAPGAQISPGIYQYNGWASTAATYNGVVTPFGHNADDLRLPMPVEWMYVLKDGTLGTLDGGDNFVKAPGGTDVSAANPIVGRVAFWTDDESCKVNINTASEPTYSGTPFYFSDRDRLWAHYPAATGEYQRYPGHPAMVALSSVFFPGVRLDQYNPDAGMSRDQIVNFKDVICNIAPKIAGGDEPNGVYSGSEAGTIPFVIDEVNGWNDPKVSSHVDLLSSSKQRLYATVDELVYNADGAYTPGTGRLTKVVTSPLNNNIIFDSAAIERSRFFLTAHSRAPEFTMHGLPRVCMWPLADESKGSSWRTNYDNMIALSGTLAPLTQTTNGSRTYYFRRLDPHHSTADVTGTAAGESSPTLQRNSKLLDYLDNEFTSLAFPLTGVSLGGSTKMPDKYGSDNTHQILIEMFDYIRCINLYDGVLARQNNGAAIGTQGNATAATGSYEGLYIYASAHANERYTYTNQRNSPPASGNDDKTIGNNADKTASNIVTVFPGHGAVTPAIWSPSSAAGRAYMGFGRMMTLSEIGLHFICTGDGLNDGNAVGSNMNSTGAPFDKMSPGPPPVKPQPFSALSGGGNAPREDEAFDANGGFVPQPNSGAYTGFNVDQTKNAVWWSNFPPISTANNPPAGLISRYGCDASKPLKDSKGRVQNPRHPSVHPGFNPDNWNITLDVDTPLESNEVRVQANLDLETFCPMLGWTKFFPEFTIVLDGTYIGQIMITDAKGNQARLFDTTGDVTIKSNSNLYEISGMEAVGGFASPAALVSGRNTKGIHVSSTGTMLMNDDPKYDSSASGPQSGLNNYNLSSNYVTVKRNESMKISMPSAPMKILIYDSHDYQNHKPIQTISLQFMDPATKSSSLEVPVPLLAGNQILAPPLQNYRVNKSGSTLSYNRGYQGPHWWAFNYNGALQQFSGAANPNYSSAPGGDGTFWLTVPILVAGGNPHQATRGRLNNTIAVEGFNPPVGAGATGSVIIVPDNVSDVIRTLVPAIGDYRVVAALNNVPAEMWKPHPMWYYQSANVPAAQQIRTIHSYTGYYGNTEAGAQLAVDPRSGSQAGAVLNPPVWASQWALVSNAYTDANSTVANLDHQDRQPDLPGQEGWAWTANSFGDFDTGISNSREGPWVNKPDEGNFYADQQLRTVNGASVTKYYRSSYFYNTWNQTDDWRNGIYMTPNRIVSSPVMFGSLSTGVWNTGNQPGGTLAMSSGKFLNPGISAQGYPARPWQTLLFRPHTPIAAQGNSVPSKATHPGQVNPMDHFLLDLFYMPVVEPYAISEPLSVAGRLNLNYQILPFTNIRRATGMHALMKGEFMTSVPNNARNTSGVSVSGVVMLKATKNGSVTDPRLWDTFWNEIKQPNSSDSTDGIYVHRPINVTETLTQFDERFKLDANIANAALMGPFRSASQICEVHLIPSMGRTELATTSSPKDLKELNSQTRQDAMNTFWSNNRATGDNIRERPYANLYSRLTNRSNTFRVHVRSQTLKKARSLAPAHVDMTKDLIMSEYRGSMLVERYIDPNGIEAADGSVTLLPDYAQTSNPFSAAPLDTFYQFRVLETRRFNP